MAKATTKYDPARLLRVQKHMIQALEGTLRRAEFVDASTPNANESCFVERAIEKGFSDISRAGWPDFLVRDPRGKIVSIEVKHADDLLSARQIHMFRMLDEVGLHTFIWWTKRPNVLTPWREFHHARSEHVKLKAGRARESLARYQKKIASSG